MLELYIPEDFWFLKVLSFQYYTEIQFASEIFFS